jgi:hypothetical protein
MYLSSRLAKMSEAAQILYDVEAIDKSVVEGYFKAYQKRINQRPSIRSV